MDGWSGRWGVEEAYAESSEPRGHGGRAGRPRSTRMTWWSQWCATVKRSCYSTPTASPEGAQDKVLLPAKPHMEAPGEVTGSVPGGGGRGVQAQRDGDDGGVWLGVRGWVSRRIVRVWFREMLHC
ncbi:hypothetical protein ZWY2020_016105 [Hordeum vulgare]|nr:hypothetical protein ZWY2020_016105 [Hordeum vulgare]